MVLTWTACAVEDMPTATELKTWNDTLKDTATMKLLSGSLEKHVPETIRFADRKSNNNLFRLIRTLLLKLPANNRVDGSPNSSLWLLSCPPKGHTDYATFFNAGAAANSRVFLAAEYNVLIWKTLTYLTRECEVLQSAFAEVHGDGARCLKIMASKLGLGQDDVMVHSKEALASKSIGKQDEHYTDVNDQISDHMQIKSAAFTAYNDACRSVDAFGQQPKLKKVMDLTDFMTETAFPTTNGFPTLVESILKEVRDGNITTMLQITDAFGREADTLKRQCANAGVTSILQHPQDTINAITDGGAKSDGGAMSGGAKAGARDGANARRTCTNRLAFSAGMDGKIDWTKTSICGGNHPIWSSDCPGHDSSKSNAFNKRMKRRAEDDDDDGRKIAKSNNDCYKWMNKGDCFKGDGCNFKHNPAKKGNIHKKAKANAMKTKQADNKRAKHHNEQLNAISAKMSLFTKELAHLKSAGTCTICQSPSQKHAAADCPFRNG